MLIILPVGPHREDGPAFIRYYRVNEVAEEQWWYYGKIQRGGKEDGPAYTRYSLNNRVVEQVWYKNHLRHREDGPAVITTQPDGSKTYSWFLEGFPYNNPIAKTDKEALEYIRNNGLPTVVFFRKILGDKVYKNLLASVKLL
jgi:hypothetical protein